MKIQAYSPEVEAKMLNFYNSLSEKDRRRYAAIEAEKLGYGGSSYIQRVLGCDDRTVTRGQQELISDLSKEDDRIRQPGGGRKSIIETTEGIDEAFLDVIENHIAGEPMNEAIKWTNLSRSTIAEKLKEKGFSISVTVVDKLLKNTIFVVVKHLNLKLVKKIFQIEMSSLKILKN